MVPTETQKLVDKLLFLHSELCGFVYTDENLEYFDILGLGTPLVDCVLLTIAGKDVQVTTGVTTVTCTSGSECTYYKVVVGTSLCFLEGVSPDIKVQIPYLPKGTF